MLGAVSWARGIRAGYVPGMMRRSSFLVAVNLFSSMNHIIKDAPVDLLYPLDINVLHPGLGILCPHAPRKPLGRRRLVVHV